MINQLMSLALSSSYAVTVRKNTFYRVTAKLLGSKAVMLFYLQELCSVGATSAVISPCAFTVICRTWCSIEEMPAGSVAIMLKLLTYVCVTPSLFRSPIMIVPPVPR
jgi:hypothetical protein